MLNSYWLQRKSSNSNVIWFHKTIFPDSLWIRVLIFKEFEAYHLSNSNISWISWRKESTGSVWEITKFQRKYFLSNSETFPITGLIYVLKNFLQLHSKREWKIKKITSRVGQIRPLKVEVSNILLSLSGISNFLFTKSIRRKFCTEQKFAKGIVKSSLVISRLNMQIFIRNLFKLRFSLIEQFITNCLARFSLPQKLYPFLYFNSLFFHPYNDGHTETQRHHNLFKKTNLISAKLGTK